MNKAIKYIIGFGLTLSLAAIAYHFYVNYAFYAWLKNVGVFG